MESLIKRGYNAVTWFVALVTEKPFCDIFYDSKLLLAVDNFHFDLFCGKVIHRLKPLPFIEMLVKHVFL